MITELLQPNELARLRNLQILARNRVEGFCSGLHRSPNKGHSVEFREHRPYSRGDELRAIDWKVFGKSDRLFVRQYEEETNLRCHLMIDTSGSMGYAGKSSKGLTKLRYASQLAMAFAYLMLNQQDSVGLVTYDDSIREYLPPRSRATHLSAMASLLLQKKTPAPNSTETSNDCSRVFSSLLPKLRRGGLVAVFSDCFGDVPKLASSLNQCRQARNDVVVFQVMDRDELDFPFRSVSEFRSLESSNLQRRIDPGRLRKAYLKKLEAWQTELSKTLLQNRVEFIQVVTDQPFCDYLANFLATRGRST